MDTRQQSQPIARPLPAPVLEARQLTKTYPLHRARGSRSLCAVEGVDLALYEGRTLALVGESGSGKSTCARMLAQMIRPTSGEILLRGRRVRVRTGRQRRRYVSDVQLLLQDPFASLNPVHSVRYQLTRVLRLHGHADHRHEVEENLEALLAKVQLTPAQQFLDKYPHELSGGQLQRVAIARALAARPRVLLLDEPVSMLDVSIRLGVLNLLGTLKDEEQLAVLYITHDIASARYFADDMLVMYRGQVVEGGASEEVTQRPAHPYPQLLIASAPDPERRGRPSTAPAPALAHGRAHAAAGAGCRFAAKCPHATDLCRDQMPARSPLSAGHWARCWLAAGDVPGPDHIDRAIPAGAQ